jgi:tmRNA-binding protein
MQKLVMATLFMFPNLLRIPGSLILPKASKLMARKGNWVALHHKGFEPKYVSRQGGQIRLGSYTNTKGKPKVQLPTKVPPKEKNHPMLETKKVTLFHQGKSSLCREQNVRRWLCATKAIYDCAMDGMLEGRFVIPRQIMFVSRMVCKIMVLRYEGKSRFDRRLNFRKLPWDTKTNHVAP